MAHHLLSHARAGLLAAALSLLPGVAAAQGLEVGSAVDAARRQAQEAGKRDAEVVEWEPERPPPPAKVPAPAPPEVAAEEVEEAPPPVTPPPVPTPAPVRPAAPAAAAAASEPAAAEVAPSAPPVTPPAPMPAPTTLRRAAPPAAPAPAAPSAPTPAAPAPPPPVAPAAPPPRQAQSSVREEPPAPPPPAADLPRVRVKLKNGTVLLAQLEKREAGFAHLVLPGPRRLALALEDVEAIEPQQVEVRVAAPTRPPPAPPEPFDDPAHTRYFVMGSAKMLEQGEVYFSQKELVYSTVGVGVTDWLTVSLGSALPLFLGEDGAHFTGGLKVGGSVSDAVHLAAGTTTLVVPSAGVVGLAYGAVTLGGRDSHLTFTVGRPLGVGDELDGATGVTLQVGGALRLGSNVALLTEHWLLTDENDTLTMNGVGFRFFGKRLSVDVGVGRVTDAPIPIPWLDFSYRFR